MAKGKMGRREPARKVTGERIEMWYNEEDDEDVNHGSGKPDASGAGEERLADGRDG
ncbi:hypothetical protein ABW21_db0205040 [Orbilia brochopaga]|nr:hypothetical protein ABW21_db0205040 [Drechslerella brochopaga]